MTPQRFGRYELLERLSAGSTAEVWRARLHGSGGGASDLIIKRLLPYHEEDPEMVEAFQSEALIAGNFDHPNIARILEFGQINGAHYIVREFIHGQTLVTVMRQVLRGNSGFPPPLCLRIVALVCEGLSYAHTRTEHSGRPLTVVHRDLHRHTVLIGFDGSVKLIGFGSTLFDGHLTRPRPGVLKAPVWQMAPEQVKGQPLDARTNLFAAGLLLYELLTGVHPFKRDTEMASLQAVLACDIQPPSEVARTPAELDPVVMKALAKARDERYSDARQFGLALEAFIKAWGWEGQASPVLLAQLMGTLFGS